MKRSALSRRTPLTVRAEKVREFQNRGRHNSRRKPRAISPASPAQRAKVRRQAMCVSCGWLGSLDPAHLVPRAHGGCDSPDCVIGLCRSCHREFDEGRLDLESVLALPDFAAERAHMAGHLSLRRCIERLTGRRLVDGEELAA